MRSRLLFVVGLMVLASGPGCLFDNYGSWEGDGDEGWNRDRYDGWIGDRDDGWAGDHDDGWVGDTRKDGGDSVPWNEPDWGTPQEETPQTGNGRFALMAARECNDVTALWRKAAARRLLQQTRSAWYTIANPVECWSDGDAGGWADVGAATDVAIQDTGYGGDSGPGADEWSSTNVQEVGVDEADFIKNDGKYIWILANGAFQVIEAFPPQEAKRIASVPIEGAPRQMFVHKDKAVVFSSLGGSASWEPCTYGFDCEFTGDGHPLKVTVLGLDDPTSPVVLRQTRFSGSYLASRRINDIVYMVVYHAPPEIPYLSVVPLELQKYQYRCAHDPFPYTQEDVETLFVELYQKNLKRLEDIAFESWVPSIQDVGYVGGKAESLGNPLDDCGGYHVARAGDGMSLVSLVSFDMGIQEAMQATTIVDRPGVVYASGQSMYLAVRHWMGEVEGGGFPELRGFDDGTSIHAFRLDETTPGTEYLASGVVPGRGLNQFSISEHQDHLRFATTIGWSGSNRITVLRRDGDILETVGQIKNLGPGETIRAVRFDGDIGYVVTFRETDPLYVVDLADPTKPTLLGELHIPGFSTYLHKLDQGHLLSIGYDADDGGFFRGIMLQVFDVTELTQPTLLHKEIIGSRGTASEAATNHLAFNYFGPRSALAVPLAICEGNDNWDVQSDDMTFNGLRVFRVSVEEGFTDLGGIPHAIPPKSDYQYGAGCQSWWTQSHTSVKRSVFMDDWVFSIALDEIRVAGLDDLANPVATVSLK